MSKSRSQTLYASLTGPLLSVYYPLPEEFNERSARVALSTSKLAKLWCSVYTESQVNESIKKYGGLKLDSEFAKRLDYDFSAVSEA